MNTDRDSIDRVIIIGCGIVNLITAFLLQSRGYKVVLFDAAPSPTAKWWQQGCTFGGEDARMFTLTEMDNYGRQDFQAAFNSPFGQRVSEGGWDIRNSRTCEEEALWKQQYDSIPSWLARSYNDDIFALNNEARFGWDALRQHKVFSDPQVFIKDNILRLYSSEQHLHEAWQRHARLLTDVRLLDARRLVDTVPWVAPAVRSGLVVGGFFVPGFTVMVHKLGRRIISWLTEHGAQFVWNSEVKAAGVSSTVVKIATNHESHIFRDAHIVASVGAYGNELLRHTPWSAKIHGVLGCWARVELPRDICDVSMKLARRGHIAEDTNITVVRGDRGNTELVFGSGYGWTGRTPGNINSSEFRCLTDGVVDTVTKFFGNKGSPPLKDDGGPFRLRYCVRPWTSTSLGIFGDVDHTSRNAFLVTGGHNTGGFAQAPATAEAVYCALRGRNHSMHIAYHPDRYESFFG